jgi:hypothetical protein
MRQSIKKINNTVRSIERNDELLFGEGFLFEDIVGNLDLFKGFPKTLDLFLGGANTVEVFVDGLNII